LGLFGFVVMKQQNRGWEVTRGDFTSRTWDTVHLWK
jgi:hypothetical protein